MRGDSVSLFNRIWAALLAPYFAIRTHHKNTEVLIQRGFWNELLITSSTRIEGTYDDKLHVQVKLSGEQAEELLRWLQVTSGSINRPKQNNTLRLVGK